VPSIERTDFGGDQDQRSLIIKNETTTIGLFQGMFEKNLLTFDPGWNSDARPPREFDDAGAIQRLLKEVPRYQPARICSNGARVAVDASTLSMHELPPQRYRTPSLE
jgi:hypothetical protein